MDIESLKLQKAYDPSSVEKKWYDHWVEQGYFRADAGSSKRPYCILIPPPNVTGMLHMGHVLNNTIQDILIRWKRMSGYETLWLPGTDHAGIATQNVVERNLKERGVTRQELGREKFLEEVWKWREQFGSTIFEQLKRLGCSCDWDRTRFTMDEGFSRAIREVFVRLYEKGLIYRGNYIINWCPRCLTALSDEEAQHEDTDGFLYHIHYPMPDGSRGVAVATTRPETMLGDVAVAINPNDEKNQHLLDKHVLLPLVDRLIPVIADEHVDPEFGTGIVKITPAHDRDDFEVGQRHGLEPLVIMDPSAKINENVPQYQGLDRYQARERVLKDLKKRGLYLKKEPHKHAVGQCYRCDTVVEPYLSRQWFVKMKPLAEPAKQVVLDGKVAFTPERWTKVYLNWLDNIRDWCISRQIWWGHRIPAWYCDECEEITVSREDPTHCSHCDSGKIHQEEDTLDTWFSSWLWPFGTMGWPEKTKDLEFFFPTDTLVTGPDIIFFWVARMVMASMEFMGDIPYRRVYLHGMVRDEIGRMMSKSLGNSPDPNDIMTVYGVDSLRFTMTLLTPQGQDVYFSEEKLKTGRNFANKLWNASRLVLMGRGNFDREGDDPGSPLEALTDRWIESRMADVAEKVNVALEELRLNDAVYGAYDFAWHEFCDWYLELIKPRINGPAGHDRWLAQHVSGRILDGILRLIHPFMPFVSEELRSFLVPDGDSTVISPYPQAADYRRDLEAEERMGLVQRVVTAIRNIRSEMNVPPGKQAEVIIKLEDDALRRQLKEDFEAMKPLAKVGSCAIEASPEVPKIRASAVVGDVQVFMPLEGLIDLDLEKTRLEKEMGRVRSDIERSNKKLSDYAFLEKAPAEVVDRERKKSEERLETLERLKRSYESLVGHPYKEEEEAKRK